MSSSPGSAQASPRLPRRVVTALAAAAIIPSRADAQGRQAAPPQGALQTVAVPCKSRPGDVVALIVDGVVGPLPTVVAFGQAFRAGDLARGAVMTARLGDGRSIQCQYDVSVRHADGSTRFAVVALLLPPHGAGGHHVVMLGTAPDGMAGGGAVRSWQEAFAGRQVAVEVTGNGGGRFQAELVSELAAQTPWQSGPLATQARVNLRVPPQAAGGVTSLRVVADIAVHSDGTLLADVWFRNDAAMRSGGGAARYSARIVLDGREALRADNVAQHHYTGWGRVLRSGPGGMPPLPQGHVRHDPRYLIEAAAIAPYDVGLGVAESVLQGYQRLAGDPAWARVLGTRGITQYFPTTGARSDIGPATQCQAVWLLTGDRRAAAVAVGQSESSGSIPWHLWDAPDGDARGAGWMSAARRVGLWTDGRGGAPPGGLLQQIPADTGWAPDLAHQPDLSYTPYLLTARRALLDQHLAQAAWCILTSWPAPQARGAGLDTARGEGVNIIRGQELRGAAWAMREIEEAAWIAPDGDPHQAYFRSVAAGNWAWLVSMIPQWTEQQGEVHGWVPGEFRAAGSTAPWQQDYFASTVAMAAQRGSANARRALGWMSNWQVGRFASEGRGFPRRDGIVYSLAVADSNTGRPYRNWSDVGAQTAARGASNGTSWQRSDGYYGQTALMALAMINNALGSSEALRAFQWLTSAGAPYTTAADFSRDPTYSIVPRGFTRGAAAMAACTPAGRSR